jgi:hypothetical protein
MDRSKEVRCGDMIMAMRVKDIRTHVSTERQCVPCSAGSKFEDLETMNRQRTAEAEQ